MLSYNWTFNSEFLNKIMKKDDEELSYATNKKNIQKTKIVFVGDQYVGKTSIINRFIKDTFDNSHNVLVAISSPPSALTSFPKTSLSIIR